MKNFLRAPPMNVITRHSP